VDVTARTIDQAVDLGSHIYHQHRLTDWGQGQRFGMRLSARTAGPIVIGTLQYGGPVRIDGAEFVDSYQVNVPVFGEVVMSYGGQQQRALPSRAVIHGPSAPTWIDGWHVPTRLIGLKIFRAGLESELASLTGQAVDRPVRFAGTLDVTSPAGQEWLALTRRLAWWTRGGDDTFITPMLVEGVIQTLLRAAPHDHSQAVTEAAAARGDAAARHAVVLMHVHASRAVPVPEIAESAGIGVRTLEKRVLARWGLPPFALLRHIRLSYARRELQQSDGQVQVAEVAARWGIRHAGRFAAHYAQEFGEPPSATVAQARGTSAQPRYSRETALNRPRTALPEGNSGRQSRRATPRPKRPGTGQARPATRLAHPAMPKWFVSERNLNSRARDLRACVTTRSRRRIIAGHRYGSVSEARVAP
jgi:AraC-like DNA-binding protein